MTLEPKHYLLFGAFLISLGTQLAGLDHGWHDAVTPSFIGGLIGQIGVMIGAVFVGAPGATAALERANQNTDLANASTRAALADPIDPSKVDPKRFIAPPKEP